MDIGMGERIREFRKSKELTQKKFAEFLKTHQNDITNIENGKLLPSRNVLTKLSEVFPNISMEYIYRGTLPMEINIENVPTTEHPIEDSHQTEQSSEETLTIEQDTPPNEANRREIPQIEQSVQDFITLKRMIKEKDEVIFQHVNDNIKSLSLLMIKRLDQRLSIRTDLDITEKEEIRRKRATLARITLRLS